jgi:hypothetical protein
MKELRIETLTTCGPHTAEVGQVVQMSCDDGAFWRIVEVPDATSMLVVRVGFWEQVWWWIVTTWDRFVSWVRS